MIKKYKTACCPRCQFKYQSEEFTKLHIEDLQSVKCQFCQKIYYIIIARNGYVCFTNYYEYHKYVENKKIKL